VQNYYNSKIQSSFEFYNIIENNGLSWIKFLVKT
jgi:hypothetical protein